VATTVKEFLEDMAGAAGRLGAGRPGPYAGPEGFVLRHGRAYEVGPEWLGARYRRGQPRHCFLNAQALVRRDLRLTYVEGFAVGALIPVLHAWAADPDGRVVDVTWPRAAAVEYFGVPFARAYALRRRGRALSLIDGWHRDWPLLRGEVPDEMWAAPAGVPGGEQQTA
jgi:hypothetical protein